MSENEEKWIIDTDPGVDDVLAILYLIKKLGKNLVLISLTQGNVHIDKIIINAKKIMTFMDNPIEIPIVEGASNPILFGTGYSYGYQKFDGLGGIEEFQNIDYSHVILAEGNSPMKIVEMCEKHQGKINFLSIGPLSNLAYAYMLNPNIVNQINRLVIMGGSTHSRGNASPVAEANFGFDPIAPQIIFNNFKRITVIGWESTEKFVENSQHLLKLKQEIESEGKKLAPKTFNAILKLHQAFDYRNGGEFCDFYSAVLIFRPECVVESHTSRFSICFDTNESLGLCFESNKKKHQSFAESLKFIENNQSDCVVVDTLDEKIILEELKYLISE